MTFFEIGTSPSNREISRLHKLVRSWKLGVERSVIKRISKKIPTDLSVRLCLPLAKVRIPLFWSAGYPGGDFGQVENPYCRARWDFSNICDSFVVMKLLAKREIGYIVILIEYSVEYLQNHLLFSGRTSR